MRVSIYTQHVVIKPRLIVGTHVGHSLMYGNIKSGAYEYVIKNQLSDCLLCMKCHFIIKWVITLLKQPANSFMKDCRNSIKL